MSRLDDELKAAFRRKEPSPDFAARVLARLGEPVAAPPKKTLWQRLASLFAPQRMQFVAAAATAMIVVAVAAFWFLQSKPASVDVNISIAEQTAPTAGAPSVQDNSDPKATDETRGTVATANKNKVDRDKPGLIRASGGRKLNRSRINIAQRATPRVSPEAEAAKEKVLFALQIASNTFNDAQRAMQYDSHNSAPERNR
ncbi:MAG TPA: hypothetical protein VNN73_22630 [Blastocatellia bacterium]|nr:hypothetical protein [Blastocatellia bacterium]